VIERGKEDGRRLRSKKKKKLTGKKKQTEKTFKIDDERGRSWEDGQNRRENETKTTETKCK
jgi:hypothetical protein